MVREIKNLGKAIRHYRKARKLTQEELSWRAGIHYTFLWHIERGNKLPSLQTLFAISKALRKDVNEFFLMAILLK